MMAGPVDECCNKCGEKERYLVTYNGGRTMDSVTIAEIMGTGHIRARANRTQAWIRTPTQDVSMDTIKLVLDRYKTLTQEEKKVIQDQIYDILPS